jgi:hypothetical protein
MKHAAASHSVVVHENFHQGREQSYKELKLIHTYQLLRESLYLNTARAIYHRVASLNKQAYFFSDDLHVTRTERLTDWLTNWRYKELTNRSAAK